MSASSEPRGVRDGYAEGVSASAYGSAIEHLAIGELLLRGHEVAVPAVDVGYDLVIDTWIRAQVKGAWRRALEPREGFSYDRFQWSGVGPKKSEGHGESSFRDRSNIEVFLLFGLEPDGRRRWWVVPAHVLAAVSGSLNFLPNAVRGLSLAVAPYEDAWDVLRDVDVMTTPQQRLTLA